MTRFDGEAPNAARPSPRDGRAGASVNTTRVMLKASLWPKAFTIHVFKSWLATMAARNAVDAHWAMS